MADVNLKTTYGDDRSKTVSTPTYEGGDLLPQNLLSILAARKAALPADGGVDSAGGGNPMVERALPGTRSSAGGGGSFSGGGGGQQFAAAPKKRNITRVINDPFANPYQLMATGQKPGAVQERYIDGVGWEFDGAGIAARGSGGGPGRIDFSGVDSAPLPALLDPRMRALVAQQSAAQPNLTPVTTNNKGQQVGRR